MSQQKLEKVIRVFLNPEIGTNLNPNLRVAATLPLRATVLIMVHPLKVLVLATGRLRVLF